MQLAYETLLKLNNLSKTEMNIFLQCVRYQDAQGKDYSGHTTNIS